MRDWAEEIASIVEGCTPKTNEAGKRVCQYKHIATLAEDGTLTVHVDTMQHDDIISVFLMSAVLQDESRPFNGPVGEA